MALAAERGDLPGLLAVLAAVLAEFTLAVDHAVTRGMGALCWRHADLQRRFYACPAAAVAEPAMIAFLPSSFAR